MNSEILDCLKQFSSNTLEWVEFVMTGTATREQTETDQIQEVTGVFTESEARQLFESTAQRYLHMSTDQFLRMWDAKKFDSPEQQHLASRVASLLPLIRHIRAGKKSL